MSTFQNEGCGSMWFRVEPAGAAPTEPPDTTAFTRTFICADYEILAPTDRLRTDPVVQLSVGDVAHLTVLPSLVHFHCLNDGDEPPRVAEPGDGSPPPDREDSDDEPLMSLATVGSDEVTEDTLTSDPID
ncbi:MAG: hypothetical protein AAFS07_18865 [Pseudomonadota bacterium]